MLILSLTDQLAGEQSHIGQTIRETIPRLTDPYRRAYYTGMAAERSGLALLHRGGMGSGAMAYDSLREAMTWYETAEKIRPPDDDDAILRWNTCARMLNTHEHLAPLAEPDYEPALED